MRFVVLPTVALAALCTCCLQTSALGTGTGTGSSTGSGTSSGTGSGTSSGGGSSTTGGGQCPDGVPLDHRSVAVACDGGNTSPLPGGQNQCLQDGDCLALDNNTRVCSCAPETRQFSGSTVDWCVPGNCTTDSDCAGGYCSPTYDPNCGSFFGFVGYYCHTLADTCVNDCDCDGGYCAYSSQAARWACGYGHCAG